MLDPLNDDEVLQLFTEVHEVVRTVIITSRALDRYRVEVLQKSHQVRYYSTLFYREKDGQWVKMEEISEGGDEYPEQALRFALGALLARIS